MVPIERNTVDTPLPLRTQRTAASQLMNSSTRTSTSWSFGAARRMSGLILATLLYVGPVTAAAQPPAAGDAPPDSQPAEGRQPYYIGTNFSFEDVDLATLERRLARFGFDLPIAVEGQMTARLRVEWPLGALTDRRAYRFQGTLTSDELTVADVRLTDVTAELDYARGNLRLEQLDFRVPARGEPDAGQRTGRFTGSGSIGIWPRGPVRTDLRLEDVPLASILQVVPQLESLGDGATISGQVSASAPAEQIQQPAAWSGSGRVSLEGFRFAELPELAASTEFQLAEGLLALRDIQAAAAGADLTGTARLQLVSPFDFTTRLTVKVPNLGVVGQLQLPVDLPLDVAGSLRATANVGGQLVPLTWTARGDVDSPSLAIDQVQLDRVSLNYVASQQSLQVSDLVVEAYGGTVTGEGSLTAEDALSARVSWAQIRGGELLADVLGSLPVPIDLVTGGSVRAAVEVQRIQDLAAWRAAGTLSGSAGSVAAVPVRVTRSTFTLRNAVLRFEEFAARIAAVPVRLDGRVALLAPHAFDVKVRAERADLRAVQRALPIELPVTLSGLFSTAADVEGTLVPLAVTGSGELRSRALQAGSIAARAVQLQFAVTPQALSLESLDATLAGGRVTASAQVPLDGQKSGSAELRWNDVQLASLVAGVLPAELQVRGRSNGALTADVPPPDKITQVSAWAANGQITVGQVRVLETVAAGARAVWRLREGRLELEPLVARVNAAEVRLIAGVGLAEPFDVRAELRVDDGQLQRWSPLLARLDLPGPIAGNFTLQSDLHGTLRPLELQGQGNTEITGLEIASVRVDQVHVSYSVEPQQLQITDASVQLYDGSARGTASLPLRPAAGAQIDVAWKAIDAGRLLADAGDWPLRLKGLVSGNLHATAPSRSVSDPAQWTLDAQATADELSANEVSLGQFKAKLAQQQRELTYSVTGTLLDGRLQGTGRWYPVGDPRAAASQAQIQLENLQLGRLGAVFPNNKRIAPLNGSLSASLAFEPQERDVPRVLGTVQIAQLRWGSQALAERLQGQVAGDLERIQLADFAGPFADGRLRFAATLPIEQPQAARWDLALRAVNIAEAAVLVAPGMAPELTGVLDLQLRGSGIDVVTAAGTAGVREASLQGLRIRSVRLPVRMRIEPRSGRGELVMRGGSAQVSGGRVTGQMQVRFTPIAAVDGDLKFTNLDLSQLVRDVGYSGSVGTGRITGTLTVEGRRVQSLQDLSGQLRATLRQTQALSLPILRQVGPYVAGASGATSFEQGEIVARLSRGVVLIERFTLSSASVQLFAEGRITLAGRLDLDVMAATGDLGQNPTLIQWLVDRLPLAAPAPVGLLLTANEYLANRVLYLQVSGTYRSPVVRVRPLPVLRDAAVRFFLDAAAQSL